MSAPHPTAGEHAVRSKKSMRGPYIVVGLLLAIFVYLVSGASDQGATEIATPAPVLSAEAYANATTPMAALTESEPEPVVNRWSYSTDSDKVRGTSKYSATTVSTNSIRQDSPYEGETYMTLTLRKSAAGNNVIFQITSGQLMCPSYRGCNGTIRFDNGKPRDVRFVGPDDDSSEVIFLESGENAFIAKLKKSKKLIVEKTLYQAGSPQFEFDVSSLEWNH